MNEDLKVATKRDLCNEIELSRDLLNRFWRGIGRFRERLPLWKAYHTMRGDAVSAAHCDEGLARAEGIGGSGSVIRRRALHDACEEVEKLRLALLCSADMHHDADSVHAAEMLEEAKKRIKALPQ